MVTFGQYQGGEPAPPQPLSPLIAGTCPGLSLYPFWDEGLAGKAFFARPTSPRLDPTSLWRRNHPRLRFPLFKLHHGSQPSATQVSPLQTSPRLATIRDSGFPSSVPASPHLPGILLN
eukprot:1188593-Prorocentrum_minimum.AAC.2